jgi:hypothetical protein
MIDSLLCRARLAIEESQRMREQRRLLRAQQEKAIDELRYAVVESASIRTEVKALRDDKR